MSDPLSFLDGDVVETQVDAPEPTVDVQEPVAEVTAPEPTPIPEPPKEEPVSEPRVPLAALHEERFKRQEEERRRQEAEQENAYLRQFVQPQEDEYIDPVVTLQAQMDLMRVNISKELAKQAHGAELVEKAHEWGFQKCNADPYFNQRIAQSSNPFADVVAEYQREQIASQVKPDEFQAFLAWKAAQAVMTGQQPATPVAPSQTLSNVQPRSIASAPSAGGAQTIPTGPGAAFDSVFKG